MRISIDNDKSEKILKTIRSMSNKRVLIGIPKDTADRNDGTGVSNALIGYVLETGSPEHNIPARPFLVPGVNSVKNTAVDILKKAGAQALNGRENEFIKGLHKVGLMAVGAVKDKMDAGPFAPLSDATLKARIRRGGGSKIGAEEELRNRLNGGSPGTSLAQPLIDTGNLQNSIVYVIREKKN